MRCEHFQVWCKGGSGGSSLGDQEADETSLIDLGADREGEGTVGLSEEARGNVWESGRYQEGLGMFRGGRARRIEPACCRRERLGGQNIRHSVADRRDLCGSGGALLLINLVGGNSRGGLTVGLVGFGTVRVEMTRDER